MSGTSSIYSPGSIAVGNGNGALATVVLNGRASMSTDTGNWQWIAVPNSGGATGVVTMNGNSTVTTDDMQIAWGGTGTVVVGDGNAANNAVLTGTRMVEVGAAGGGDATLTVNAGGMVATPQIQSSGSPASTVINLNGGTLKAHRR